MTTIYILIASFAVMLMSLVGIFTSANVFKDWAERNLKYLATFATGVFVIVAYNLIKETTHSEFALTTLLGIMLFGVLIAYLIDHIIPNSHHHHDNTESVGTHSKAGAQRIIFSDFLHNITDGFLIVPAFLVDVRIGILTTAGIMIHEVAQEISEFFVMRNAGYSTKKALILNFATSGSILIGVVGALFISNISENIIFALLSVAAGIIIYTILKDLIPYSYRVAKQDKTYGKHFAIALIGAVILLALTGFTSETHNHSSGEHSEDEHIEEVHTEDVNANNL